MMETTNTQTNLPPASPRDQRIAPGAASPLVFRAARAHTPLSLCGRSLMLRNFSGAHERACNNTLAAALRFAALYLDDVLAAAVWGACASAATALDPESTHSVFLLSSREHNPVSASHGLDGQESLSRRLPALALRPRTLVLPRVAQPCAARARGGAAAARWRCRACQRRRRKEGPQQQLQRSRLRRPCRRRSSAWKRGRRAADIAAHARALPHIQNCTPPFHAQQKESTSL